MLFISTPRWHKVHSSLQIQSATVSGCQQAVSASEACSSWLEFWNPRFAAFTQLSITSKKDCSVAKLLCKCPTSLCLLKSFWVEVCFHMILETIRKATTYLCQPVSAIPWSTSVGVLLATFSHWRWFCKWCPMSVRDWFTPVAPLKALANHTLEKPHLRYFSTRSTEIRHKRTLIRYVFSPLSALTVMLQLTGILGSDLFCWIRSHEVYWVIFAGNTQLLNAL